MAIDIEEGYDGLFSLCVFNAEDCTDDELHKIFGKFGDIVNLSRVSNIAFIRYQTREEATKCYQQMQGHEKFNVKPGKKKGGANNAGRNNTRFGDMNRNDNSRGWRPEASGSSGGSIGHPNSVAGGGQLPPLPKLIPFPAPTEESDAKDKPTAKIVFIGNLNPKMGQSSVYELCNKAQAPALHVAMKAMKRPPYPAVSYAVVYVKNDKDVSNIVNGLNNLKLNGYKLFVSPIEKMVEGGRALLNAK